MKVEQRCGVGTEGEEGRVAKGEQARIADQQVEAGRQDDKDQRNDRDMKIVVGSDQTRQDQQNQSEETERNGNRQTRGSLHDHFFPNRPSGL